MADLSAQDFQLLENWSLSTAVDDHPFLPAPILQTASPPPNLPPEILYHIFDLTELVKDYYSAPGELCRAVQAQSQFLTSASLVCKNWTGAASAALWQAVHLSSEEAVESFISNGGRSEYDTTSMTVFGPHLKGVTGVGPATLERLLSEDGGTLKSLTLSGYRKKEELKWSMLCNGNLKGLTSLTLLEVYFWFTSDYNIFGTLPRGVGVERYRPDVTKGLMTSLPFQLESLQLSNSPTTRAKKV